MWFCSCSKLHVLGLIAQLSTTAPPEVNATQQQDDTARAKISKEAALTKTNGNRVGDGLETE